MPTVKDVLEQSELKNVALLHHSKSGTARTLQSWTAQEGFPEEDELQLLTEMHAEPGRYRVTSKAGKSGGRSATLRLIKGDGDALAPKASEGVLATQLVRMAHEVTSMAQVAMQSATDEKREAMQLLREQSEMIAELRVQLATSEAKPTIGEQVLEGAFDALNSNPELAQLATQGAGVILGKVVQAIPAKARGKKSPKSRAK